MAVLVLIMLTTLTQGGVDVLNTGGAIAKATDPALAYATLVKEINKHGVI